MGVLDTFYILFKTDADKEAEKVAELEQNAVEAAAAVDKIGKVDGTGVDKLAGGLGKAAGNAQRVGSAANQATNQTNQLGNAMQRADRTAGSLGRSFVNAVRTIAAPLIAGLSVGALADIATTQAQKIRELDQSAAKLNSSIGNVDAFRRAIRGAGGDMEQASDSLAKISEKINEAFSDKESGARKDFKEWGLAFQDNKKQALGAVEGIVALAGNLEKVSRGEALARIKKLGIEDKATIEVLLQGRKAVEDLLEAEKRRGVVTERQAQIAREYQRELGRTQSALQSIGDRIMEAVLPAVTQAMRYLGRFVDWIGENQTLVTGFFIGVAGVVTAVFLPAMASAAAAVIAATWPFLAIGAAIAAVGAAFALAYEDVVAFMNGQPSLIGELVKQYEWVAAAVEIIGSSWQWLSGIAATAWDKIIAGWDAVVNAFTEAWPTIKATFAAITSGATSFVEGLIAVYTPLARAWGNVLSAIWDVHKAVFEQVIAAVTSLVGDWGSAIGEISTNTRAIFNDILEFLKSFGIDVGAIVGALPEVFRVMAGIIKSIWEDLVGWMAGRIQWLADKISSVAAWIRGGGTAQVTGANDNIIGLGQTAAGNQAAADIGSMVNSGRSQLNNATATPLGAQTPGSLRGAAQTTVENNQRVNVGGVTIQTQATDAEGIAAAVGGELDKRFRQTVSNFDDGVDH